MIQSLAITITGSASNIISSTDHTSVQGLIKSDITDHIIGGTEVVPFAYPWITYLDVSGKGVCGGSLLDESTIVTAAHCTPRELKNSRAIAYAHNLKKSEEENNLIFEVYESIQHEKYNSRTSENDIAVWKVKLIQGDPSRMPINLVTFDDGSFSGPGEELTVAGWGAVTVNGALSAAMRETKVFIISNEECKRSYRYIYQSSLCAGKNQIKLGDPNGGHDSCYGDSGGPLFRTIDSKVVLVGIVSYGYKCGLPNSPGVYSRISFHADWIKSKMG